MFKKFFVSFVVFTLLLGGVFFGMKYFSVDEVSFEILLIFVGILLVYMVFSFLYIVIKPFRTLLTQVQLVLNGKKFKKIYTRRTDEVGVLAHFFNEVTNSFTKVASDIKDRERILDELSVATELQKGLFPAEAPAIDGISIVMKNRPATELGGDSYDFVEVGNKVYMYVGDVTGHGVTAGLIMAMVNSMISSFAEVYDNAYEVIVHTNKNIRKYVKPAMYMTLVMLCWDKEAKKMTYVGAGHEKILIYRKATGQLDEIVSGGTALGMVPEVPKDLSEKEIPLGKGDMVVLYSDGITEAKNSTGELYGLDKLKTAIIEYGTQYTASGVSHHISQDLAAFVGDESQLDDMTLIVVEKV